jgi:hypothetical protein
MATGLRQPGPDASVALLLPQLAASSVRLTKSWLVSTPLHRPGSVFDLAARKLVLLCYMLSGLDAAHLPNV